MSPASGETPRIYQIVDSIREQISSGQLAPGDQVPTIGDIKERWQVAQATAQAALAVLKREGVITGGRGKPATVRIPQKRVRIDDTMRQAQKDVVRRSLDERRAIGKSELSTGTPLDQTKFNADYEFVAATSELAEAFSVEPGTRLLQRTYETTDLSTGFLLLWSKSWIPVSLIEGNPDLLDVNNEPWVGGHQHQLFTVGIEVDRFENSVIAVIASSADRDLWGIDQGVPFLKMCSKSIDTENRVVEMSESIYPGDRAEIAWTEQLRRWS